MSKIFSEQIILNNLMASNSINVKKDHSSIVHIDSFLPHKETKNTTDMNILFCLDDFTKENGATKVWPKSHLTGVRIHNKDQEKYLFKKKNNFKYVEAKKGSIAFFLGQTWHQIGKNTNSKRRWGIFSHYTRWWLKPATDFTKCGPTIYKTLNQKQKQLFGFNSIPPRFNFKTQKKPRYILRKPSKLPPKYSKAIQY